MPEPRGCCPVVELRQYTLRPGERDVLIELFDRCFVESEEAVGMRIVGQFHDLDDPDRFVWLRGFADMTVRAQALSDFYGGPVWREHRDAANATMLDSDNVLLLRPARPPSGFPLDAPALRSPAGDGPGAGLVVATINYLAEPADADLLDLLERVLEPALAEAGAPIAASFVTESSPNTFPALPVREDEQVLVWFSCFPDATTYERCLAALDGSRRWRAAASELRRRLVAPPETLRLSPTSRSQLHG